MLEIGKTYRANGGHLVKIMARVFDEVGKHPFLLRSMARDWYHYETGELHSPLDGAAHGQPHLNISDHTPVNEPTPVPPTPLTLSRARQDWLAAVAEKAAQVCAEEETVLSELGEWFCDHIVNNPNGMNSQSFDDMYDQLHRSGANS